MANWPVSLLVRIVVHTDYGNDLTSRELTRHAGLHFTLDGTFPAERWLLTAGTHKRSLLRIGVGDFRSADVYWGQDRKRRQYATKL
jgi:hypothetical protein